MKLQFRNRLLKRKTKLKLIRSKQNKQKIKRKVKLKGRSITVKVKYFDFKVNQRSYTAAKYSNLETDFYEDATLLLDKMLLNKKKIRLLGVKFSEFISGDEAVQESIFDDIDKKENLLNKLDTIRKKYDFGIVKFGRTIKLK